MNRYAVVLQLKSGQAVLWDGEASDRYQAKLEAIAEHGKECSFVSCTKLRPTKPVKESREKPAVEIVGNITTHRCL